MSATPTPASAPFPSFAALRSAHSDLVEQNAGQGTSEAFDQALDTFIQRARATGLLLDVKEERWSAQSLLDYWATSRYRPGSPPLNTRLDDFDPQFAPALPNDECPYLGLDAFHEADAALFFGRQRVVVELTERLRTAQLAAIVGPSGSGKSSLVRAGLIPILRLGVPPVGRPLRLLPPMVPGSEPLMALEQTLQELGDEPALLVIDQFEEAFTLCADEKQRAVFLDRVVGLATGAAVPHRVVLTMRSDFEQFVARDEVLLQLFEANKITLPPLSASEMREAIERPAKGVGLKFEAGVVELLLQDILGEPAGLPLLQFTLLKLWEQRVRNRVTLEAYKRVGGGRLALARSADTLYNSMIPQDQITTRRMLLRMVRVNEKLEVTSNRVRQSQLSRGTEDPERVARVLGRLVTARLVRLTVGESAGDTQVEVAHEALVRNWPALVDWLEEERLKLRQRQRLTAAAEEWQRLGHTPSALLRGALLAEAQNYDDLNDVEAEFVRVSQNAEDVGRAREQRVNRQLRWLTISATLFALIAIVFGIFAEKRSQNLNYQLLAVVSRYQALDDPELGVLLAYEAASRSDTLITALALRDTLGQLTTRFILPNTGAVNSAIFSPDGTRIVTASDDGTARIWDVDTATLTGTLRTTLQGHSLQGQGAAINSAAFNHDGTRIVTASDDAAMVWDAATGKFLFELRDAQSHDPPIVVNSAAFNHDGTRIVTASDDGTARIWDVADPSRVRLVLLGHSGAVNSAAFNHDGTRIVTASEDGTARIWDVAGTLLTSFQGHSDAVNSVAFSPDGTRIVTASDDQTARVWVVDTGQLQALPIHTGAVNSVAFSPDGSYIVTASEDGTARTWDVTNGRLLTTFEEKDSPINGAAFSPDGTLVVTASDNGNVHVWAFTTAQLIATLQGHTGTINSAAFSSDQTRIVTASSDGTARVWDATTGKPLMLPLSNDYAINSAAFSPDAKKIVTVASDTAQVWDVATGKLTYVLDASQSGDTTSGVISAAFNHDGTRIVTTAGDTAQVWDAATGKFLFELRDPQSHDSPIAVNSAAFNHNSTRIVTASDDGIARIWAAATGKFLFELRDTQPHDSPIAINSAAFGANGARVVTASDDGTARIWDARNGKLLITLQGHTERVNSAAFNTDGTRIVTASDDRTARIWDASNGQLQTILPLHTGAVHSAVFNHDGTRVVTTSDDPIARIYLVNTKDLLKVAHCLVNRKLKDDEIKQFKVTRPLAFDRPGECPPNFSSEKR